MTPETTEMAKLDKHIDSIARYETTAAMLDVCDDETLSSAAVFVKDLRAQVNEIESERKELVKPFNDGVKAINAKAKALVAPLNTIRSALEQKMLAYQDARQAEVDRKQREAEEAALMAAQKAEEENRPADAAAIIEKAATVAPKTEAVRSTTATTSVRKTWAFEITNPGEISRAYLTIDEAKIRAAIKDGIREIPGVRIYQERKTIVL